MRSASIIWHLIVVVLCYKYPGKLQRFINLFVMPSYITNFVFTSEIDNILGSTMGAASYYLIMSILLNT